VKLFIEIGKKAHFSPEDAPQFRGVYEKVTIIYNLDVDFSFLPWYNITL